MTKTPKTPRTPKTQDPRRLFVLGVLGVLGVLAATAPLEDLPNTAPVVTNEEDAVAMAAVGALGEALSNDVAELSSAFDAKLAGGTNAVMETMDERLAAESNRIEATYAKLSDIPAQDDLSPYALKSELPTDYLTENDITNFATRAWIASQGYATSAGTAARLDAQDLAIAAASNALWLAHLAEAARLNAASNALAQAHAQDMAALRAADTALSNRLEQARSALDSAWRAGTNAVMQTVGRESKGLDSATNKVWQSALRADEALQREIAALRIVAADSNAVTRLVTADGSTWQDATGTVWQVQVATSLWTVVHSWTTNDVNWSGPWWWGAEAAGDDYYDGSGWYISSSSLTPMRMSEDPYASEIVVEWTYLGEEEHSVTTRCTRTVQWLTNAIDRVAYTNDVAEAIWQLADHGTVRNAEQLVDTMTGDSVTARDVINATNYTDRVASEFEDGTRTVMNANNAGNASSAGFADKLSGDAWDDQYNANDLMRASTNAAYHVSTNVVTNLVTKSYVEGLGISGGGVAQEWRVVDFEPDAGTVLRFVTNGMAHAVLFGGMMGVETNGWPDGAAMFVRFDQGSRSTPSELPAIVHLVGYGTWPTNDFQSVWWRSGTNIFVKVLYDEVEGDPEAYALKQAISTNNAAFVAAVTNCPIAIATATTNVPGIVKVDGTTITVSNGTISAATSPVNSLWKIHFFDSANHEAVFMGRVMSMSNYGYVLFYGAVIEVDLTKWSGWGAFAGYFLCSAAVQMEQDHVLDLRDGLTLIMGTDITDAGIYLSDAWAIRNNMGAPPDIYGDISRVVFEEVR